MNALLRRLQPVYRFAQESRATTPAVIETASGKDKYRNYHKTGPELYITKVLMLHGPLTNKEIWRIYQKDLHQARHNHAATDFEYWPSLTKMKETIKFMRLNEKVKSNGYSYKTHMFNGWKVDEKRALKYVHPLEIHKIQTAISQRENL